jgi:prolyl-tRNA editing enzyme YbaK/EbsC (Cys-tRNA(Pro) deacylase)
MSLPLPEGAQRVQDFLSGADAPGRVRLLPDSTATALEAATVLGISVSQIGKSIVFGSDAGLIVAVVCGDQKVDAGALAGVLRTENVRLLKADEVKAKTGYAIGGVSPFALPSSALIVVDSRLHGLPDCYVAAGHPKAVVHTDGRELIELTGARVGAITLATRHAT